MLDVAVGYPDLDKHNNGRNTMPNKAQTFTLTRANQKAVTKLQREINQLIQRLNRIAAKTMGRKPAKLEKFEYSNDLSGHRKQIRLAKGSGIGHSKGPGTGIANPLMEFGVVLCNHKTHHGVIIWYERQFCQPIRC